MSSNNDPSMTTYTIVTKPRGRQDPQQGYGLANSKRSTSFNPSLTFTSGMTFNKAPQLPYESKKILQDTFEKFEYHKITKEGFKKIIEGELGIQCPPQLDKKLDKPNLKFADLVKTLPILAPKESLEFKSSIQPLTGNHHRYKKAPQTDYRQDDDTREHFILENVRGLLTQRVSTTEFLKNLESHNIDTSVVQKDIKRYENTHYGNFKDLGVKLMKELNASNHKNLTEKPSRSDKTVIVQTTEMLKQLKSASPKKKLLDHEVDANHIEQQNRLMNTGGNLLHPPKKGAPIINLAANKTNGDIITWQKTNILDIEKPSGIRKIDSHRGKFSSIAKGLKPKDDNSFVIGPTSSKGKVNKLHMSSVDFFRW